MTTSVNAFQKTQKANKLQIRLPEADTMTTFPNGFEKTQQTTNLVVLKTRLMTYHSILACNTTAPHTHF
jgi:hypothetical protein